MSIGQEFGLADAEATKSSSSDDPSQLTGAAVPKARGAGKVLGTPRGTTEKTEEKAQAEEKKEPEVKEQVEEKNPLEMTYVIPGNGVATRSGRQLFAPSMRIDFGPSLQELLAKTEFSIKARAEDPPEQREYNASRGREIIMGQLERSKWDQGPTVDSIWGNTPSSFHVHPACLHLTPSNGNPDWTSHQLCIRALGPSFVILCISPASRQQGDHATHQRGLQVLSLLQGHVGGGLE